MSLAQDEADALLNRKEQPAAHPEDLAHFSGDEDHHDTDDERNEKRTNRIRAAAGSDSDESDIDFSSTMVSKPAAYHIPSTVFDANTGPKGVIADAQSYERAKKRSFRRTLMGSGAFDYSPFSKGSAPNASEKQSQNSSNSNYIRRGSSADGSGEESDEDERFMRQWREARMMELQNKSTRRVSPSKRRYGNVDTVDANGYLDAIEKVTPGTVVVVCIYDPESTESSIVEDSLTSLARKQATTHFVKLHYEIAEMDHITAPALIAYRNGEVFATIIDVLNQLPNGRGCSSSSIEDLLMQHKVL
ncbi:putative Phosducin [Arthroderma uncinatum]|uniref:putative Phosducin n=1 Tax=Arthroderma uncinatum TaxID=74035 RepID=UPI00144AA4F4|nr:putative Phosducin [Arthroderma uncinatum]KAF3483469.1 putative Phosducin [Arthroderma uncinatum]